MAGTRGRETSRDYRRPHRPAVIRLFNRVVRAGAKLGADGAPRFDLDELEARARADTGLSDFGDPRYREPLARLLWSMEHEARLHPLGARIQEARILDALRTRLRIEELLRQNPEIGRIELGPILVIAGLQRTGTTKLHRLLAADPNTRALRSWEALSPVEGRGRVLRARVAQHALRYMAPDFFAIHPVEYDAPEEDILLLDLCFSSQTAEAIMRVPSYAAWIARQDQRFAYEYLARCLRLLSWQQGPSRWVLKSPHHLEYLDTLGEVFGRDAVTIVQTHRDPLETTASFCSMVAHGYGVFSDEVDPHELGHHWLAKIRHVGHRAQATRERGTLRVCDVHYEDLIRDPIAEVERIYAAAGLELGREVVAAMRKHDGQHRPGRHGVHRYGLADFGLTPAAVDEALGFMRQLAPTPRLAGPHVPGVGESGSRPSSSPRGAAKIGHESALAATLTGLHDLVERRRTRGRDLAPLDDSVRIDGRVCLVTGANSGLGRATAAALARRGASVILACRSGVPETARELSAETGNPDISMIQVDLADLDSVEGLCTTLRERGTVLDLVVLNAGLVSRHDRPSAQGYELMFAVHVLANATLLRRFVDDGVLRPAPPGRPQPRVILVSSEAHRSAPPTSIEDIGTYFSYGVRGAMREYGRSKLLLCALAIELRRRVAQAKSSPDEAPWLAVHALCPGPVASRLAREAPVWTQVWLDPVMRQLFNSPEQACAPVEYLACAPELEGHAGRYLHMMRPAEIAEAARDPEFAAAVWDTCARLASRP